jgi:hypothetical protein
MPRDALALRHDQRAFLNRHRSALPAQRRAVFDKAIQNTLAGEPAPEAVAAAVSRAFEAAMAAASELPRHLFRKDIP